MTAAIDIPEVQRVPAAWLDEIVRDARATTLALVRDLDADQLMGPKLDIVNPLLWEIGHVAWFQDHFVRRWLEDRAPLLPGADDLYDSMRVAHDDRWDLPLPMLADTLGYLERTCESVLARLERPLANARDSYLYQLVTHHEDMHDEAFAYSRQTLGYRPPRFGRAAAPPPPDAGAGPWPGDVAVPGGRFLLGRDRAAGPAAGFVFDNEKWGSGHDVAPFRIARAPVTNAVFAGFVADRGYARAELWSADGWAWRARAHAQHPVYWVADRGGWRLKRFDRVVDLPPHQPVSHVNWYEADAYCRWAGRRLPSELEWEVAAVGAPAADGRGLAPGKRRFPWGDAPPDAAHAHLDGAATGTIDVAALPAGDSAFGCRQMLGNVWQWTASDFVAYPGFAADPYADYSAPWFGSRKVLRGGCWATRARLVTPLYRNFFTPERRDVFAGFRTCALD
jgi:iron(II)-dependent oxidoreductase